MICGNSDAPAILFSAMLSRFFSGKLTSFSYLGLSTRRVGGPQAQAPINTSTGDMMSGAIKCGSLANSEGVNGDLEILFMTFILVAVNSV